MLCCWMSSLQYFKASQCFLLQNFRKCSPINTAWHSSRHEYSATLLLKPKISIFFWILVYKRHKLLDPVNLDTISFSLCTGRSCAVWCTDMPGAALSWTNSQAWQLLSCMPRSANLQQLDRLFRWHTMADVAVTLWEFQHQSFFATTNTKFSFSFWKSI
jgi:hypothetical protein